MESKSILYNKYINVLFGGLVLAGLYAIKQYNYLLFHSFAELFSIIIGFGIFIVAYNTRKFQENNYFLFIGVAYVFVAGIDLLHAFSYKGTNIFPLHDSNLPTQLWIAARYLESLSLLLAPLVLTQKGRKIKTAPLVFIYAMIFSLLLLSILYFKIFPASFIEGQGLTPFKKISEYIISLILIGSFFILYQKRQNFEKPVFRLIGASVFVTALSELSFTLYADPYGFFNMIGHYLKIISFYLIYRAVIVTGLNDPYNFLFRNTKKNEEALETALSESHQRQAEMQALLDSTQAIIVYKDFKEAAQAIFNSCKSLIGAEGGCLALQHKNGTEDEVVVSESNCHLCSLTGAPNQVLNKLRTDIYKTGKPFYDNNLNIEALPDQENGLIKFKNMLLAPVFHGQKTVGILSFTNKPEGFTEDDAKISITFGRLISIALTNQLAEEEILKLKLGIERSNEAIFITDKDGAIIYANPTFEKLYGYKKEEVIGQNPRILKSGAHEKAFYEGFWETLLSKKPVSREIINKTKDGRHIFVEASANPILNENGKTIGFLAIQKDITERKNIEEKLKKSEQKYRDIVETAQEGIWILNPQRKIVYANQRMAEILGLKTDSLINKDASEFYADKEMPTFQERRERGTRERQITKKDGSKIWVLESMSRLSDERGNDIGALEMITDITGRKITEEKIKAYAMQVEREKAEDEALLSSIGDAIVAVDPNDKILYVNKAFEKLINIEAKDLKDKILEEILSLQDHRGNFVPPEFRPISAVLKSGKKIAVGAYDKPYYLAKDSKTKIPLAITAAPIILDGKTIGAIAVYRDVTKEKEVDKAKTEFVSLASHQLRTPLSSIGLSAEMLISGIAGELSKEQKKYLRTISSGIKEMTDLIEALLNVSRIEMGTLVISPEPTNLPKLTDDVLKKFAMQIKNKRLKLKKQYAENLPDVSVDQKLMRLVLDNLLSNAVKYTQPKDLIEIEIAKKSPDVLIRISDTGCGIPRHQHSEVFKKLFRSDNALKSETKGTGLGLYIVRSCVEQYGGKVWFESEEQKGAAFYVTVPLKGMSPVRSLRQNI